MNDQSDGSFPSLPGADGVGRSADGRRVYFVRPEAPYGALAEKSVVRAKNCVAVPDGIEDVTVAAVANPGMSAWASLVERVHLRPGETVLVDGATGTAGRLAVQLAKYLGAGKVIATGRNERSFSNCCLWEQTWSSGSRWEPCIRLEQNTMSKRWAPSSLKGN